MYTNFLEELVAEYFDYYNYFIKNNIKIRKRERGGYDREIDILAYCPKKNFVYHIETSYEASKWDKKLEDFKKKFDIEVKEYAEVLGADENKLKIFKRAILLEVPKTNREEKKAKFKAETGAKVLSIEEFMRIVEHKLKKHPPPTKKAIPMNLPLLRTIQFVIYYLK